MYVAVNKQDEKQVHSFTWTPQDDLIICGCKVNPSDWEIVQMFAEETKPVEKVKETKLNQLVNVFVDGTWDCSHEDKIGKSPVVVYSKGKHVQMLASQYDAFIDNLEEIKYDCYFCPELYSHPQWNGEVIYM